MESEPHSEPHDDVIEAATERVDQRMQWRRAEDIRRNAVMLGLSALLVCGGIAWGTATQVVHEKVDKADFSAHIAAEKEYRLLDSLRTLNYEATLRRIEAKVDSGNNRVSRFICYKQPIYCQ